VRYQTCKLSAHLVALKLVDVTGDTIGSMTTGWLAPEPTG
jgi:hypothetical protein